MQRKNIAKKTKFNKKCNKRFKKDAGIDGILVTLGLCIIALFLCVIMRNQLAGFVESVVGTMTDKASEILKDIDVAVPEATP